jgi:N-acetylmuramoyl-L-alanine amidase
MILDRPDLFAPLRAAASRFAFLSFVWLFLVVPAQATEVRSVGVAALSDGAVAVVIDATGAATVNAIALKSPKRLVLDVFGVPYKAEARQGDGLGFVSGYRIGDSGQKDAAGTRIILDLTEAALAESIEMLPGESGTRMIVRLIKADPGEFDAAALETLSDDVVATGSIKDAPAPSGGVSVATGSDLDDKVVITIDPGHGGADPGAVAPGGIVEKTVVLDYALVLRDLLERTGRFRVVMTRSDDRFVPLKERVRIAREAQSALMISLHADTLSDEPGVRGATVYTLGERASDARSARLAEKENAVDALGGVTGSVDDADATDILFDLARRETRSFSNGFAGMLVSRLGDAVKINKNPHRFARFQVLTAPDVPSILVELGYLSSQEDAKLVTSPEWRAKAAEATALAINAFVDRRSAMLQPLTPEPLSSEEGAAENADAE